MDGSLKILTESSESDIPINLITISNLSNIDEPEPALFDTIIVSVLVILCCLIGFLFNGAAIFLFMAYWSRLSRHMINWLMFNMAITNILSIAFATVTLFIEVFPIIDDSRLIEKIFLVDQRENTPCWIKCILSIQSITFNVSIYSLFALSIERWLIISGRRRKQCRYELIWTAILLVLIWIGAILHAYSRIRLSHGAWAIYYQACTAILFTDIIPCFGIGIFFVISARWLLYSYGASDDFSVKNLKARNRTARYLLCYTTVLPLCICSFALIQGLFLFDETRKFLRGTTLGQFFVHVSFIFDNCILQCLHPTLLFMLSSRYRQCAHMFLERMRDCTAPSDSVSYG